MLQGAYAALASAPSAGSGAYVGHVSDRPDVSPLFADHSGVPSALVIVGALDILLEDWLAMAARLSSTRAASRDKPVTSDTFGRMRAGRQRQGRGSLGRGEAAHSINPLPFDARGDAELVLLGVRHSDPPGSPEALHAFVGATSSEFL